MPCTCVHLRHRIALQTPTPTPTPSGVTTAWNAYASNVPASIEPLPLTYAGQFVRVTVQTPITHKVTLRYRSALRARDRVIYRDQTLYIVDVRHLDRTMTYAGSHWTELACEERAA